MSVCTMQWLGVIVEVGYCYKEGIKSWSIGVKMDIGGLLKRCCSGETLVTQHPLAQI